MPHRPWDWWPTGNHQSWGKKISIPQPFASGFCGLMAVTGKLIAKASFVLLTKEDNRGGEGGHVWRQWERKKGMDVVKEDAQRSLLRLVWQKWMLGTGWDGDRWSVEQQRPPRRRRNSFIYCPTLDEDVILKLLHSFLFSYLYKDFWKG